MMEIIGKWKIRKEIRERKNREEIEYRIEWMDGKKEKLEKSRKCREMKK